MVRALSMFGLGGIFLMISPKLRGSVQEGIGNIYNTVQLYAPFSYIGLVVLLIIVILHSFRVGAEAR